MIVFDTILVMLAFAVLLLALARILKLPYPVLLHWPALPSLLRKLTSDCT